MSHISGMLVLGGVLSALGIACLFGKRARVPAVGFLAIAAVALMSALMWSQTSKSAPGVFRSAMVVESPSGPRIAVIDGLTHTNPLGLIPRRGGGGGGLHWQERRFNVFDFDSGKRLARRSLDGTNYTRAELFGDIGGLVAVPEDSFVHRLRLLSADDGHEVGGLDALTARIAAANPSLGALGSAPRFDESSGCLEVRTDALAIKVDPRSLRVVEADRCANSQDGRVVAFSPHDALEIKEAPQDLPPGTRALKAVYGIFMRHGRASTPIEPARFVNPRFAIDARSGQPIFAGNPRGALAFHGDAHRIATVLSPAGAVVWETPLPDGAIAAVTVLGNQVVLVLAPGKLVVIDADTGKVTRNVDLR